MKTPFAYATALSALVLTFTSSAFAVTVPPGVTLAASQEITRQVPAETESLDPAHIESWTGNTIALDMFEGLTRIDAAGAVVPASRNRGRAPGPTRGSSSCATTRAGATASRSQQQTSFTHGNACSIRRQALNTRCWSNS